MNIRIKSNNKRLVILRVAFAAARDGLFPVSLSMLNKNYLTPWMAMFSIVC